MREDALPQPVSPYGVTKLAAEQLCYLYHANSRRAGHLGAVLHGLRAAAASRHGVPPLHPGGARNGEPITLYGDGEQTRDFTFVTDAVAATIAAGERGRPGARLQHRRRLARLGQPACSRSSSGFTGRPLDIRREPAQKGDMRDTFADTIARPAGPRVSRRPSRSNRAWRRNIDGWQPARWLVLRRTGRERRGLQLR